MFIPLMPARMPAAQMITISDGATSSGGGLMLSPRRADAVETIIETLERHFAGTEVLPRETLTRLLETLTRILKMSPPSVEGSRDLGARIGAFIDNLPSAIRNRVERDMLQAQPTPRRGSGETMRGPTGPDTARVQFAVQRQERSDAALPGARIENSMAASRSAQALAQLRSATATQMSAVRMAQSDPVVLQSMLREAFGEKLDEKPEPSQRTAAPQHNVAGRSERNSTPDPRLSTIPGSAIAALPGAERDDRPAGSVAGPAAPKSEAAQPEPSEPFHTASDIDADDVLLAGVTEEDIDNQILPTLDAFPDSPEARKAAMPPQADWQDQPDAASKHLESDGTYKMQTQDVPEAERPDRAVDIYGKPALPAATAASRTDAPTQAGTADLKQPLPKPVSIAQQTDYSALISDALFGDDAAPVQAAPLRAALPASPSTRPVDATVQLLSDALGIASPDDTSASVLTVPAPYAGAQTSPAAPQRPSLTILGQWGLQTASQPLDALLSVVVMGSSSAAAAAASTSTEPALPTMQTSAGSAAFPAPSETRAPLPAPEAAPPSIAGRMPEGAQARAEPMPFAMVPYLPARTPPAAKPKTDEERPPSQGRQSDGGEDGSGQDDASQKRAMGPPPEADTDAGDLDTGTATDAAASQSDAYELYRRLGGLG